MRFQYHLHLKVPFTKRTRGIGKQSEIGTVCSGKPKDDLMYVDRCFPSFGNITVTLGPDYTAYSFAMWEKGPNKSAMSLYTQAREMCDILRKVCTGDYPSFRSAQPQNKPDQPNPLRYSHFRCSFFTNLSERDSL